MKKGSRIALVVIGVVAVLCIALIAGIVSGGNIAQSPARIARKAGWNIPAFTVESQDDNFDRGASANSWVEYILKLDNPLSEKQIQNLKDLCFDKREWTYERNIDSYVYRSASFDADDCSEPEIIIIVSVTTGQVMVSYSWEEL